MFNDCYGHFYWFQQDNATCHKAAQDELETLHNVNMIPMWPSKSPDLSPIEMVWAIIKKKLKGKMFSTRHELYEAVKEQWNAIPCNVIDNLLTSFRARLTICAKLNGECLNGFWDEVHKEHNKYRE